MYRKEKMVCEYSVWAPEYLDYLKWTESPTIPPTSGPTTTPRPTTPPPTTRPKPTKEALHEFLYGTSTGHSSQGQTEDGVYFDDAFFEINGDNGTDPNAVNGATSIEYKVPDKAMHMQHCLREYHLATINILCY
jgi:hypothetical protein